MSIGNLFLDLLARIINSSIFVRLRFKSATSVNLSDLGKCRKTPYAYSIVSSSFCLIIKLSKTNTKTRLSQKQITDSQVLKKSGASADVVTRERTSVEQVQVENTSHATIGPVAATTGYGF